MTTRYVVSPTCRDVSRKMECVYVQSAGFFLTLPPLSTLFVIQLFIPHVSQKVSVGGAYAAVTSLQLKGLLPSFCYLTLQLP